MHGVSGLSHANTSAPDRFGNHLGFLTFRGGGTGAELG
jgi:hypothetical protein